MRIRGPLLICVMTLVSFTPSLSSVADAASAFSSIRVESGLPSATDSQICRIVTAKHSVARPVEGTNRDAGRLPAVAHQWIGEFGWSDSVRSLSSKLRHGARPAVPASGRPLIHPRLVGVLGGVLGGMFAGGAVGAAVEGKDGNYDSPGLKGFIIGAAIGGVAGGIVGAKLVR
jgi:hypothetical protein